MCYPEIYFSFGQTTSTGTIEASEAFIHDDGKNENLKGGEQHAESIIQCSKITQCHINSINNIYNLKNSYGQYNCSPGGFPGISVLMNQKTVMNGEKYAAFIVNDVHFDDIDLSFSRC